MDQFDHYAPSVVLRGFVPYHQEVQKHDGVLFILLKSWITYVHLSAYNAVGCRGVPAYYKKYTQALTVTEQCRWLDITTLVCLCSVSLTFVVK
jgi:hypothetical protein